MGKHYGQLDLDERIELCRHHDAGKAPSEIARIMGGHPSTIGRELRRNSLSKGGYRPASADRIALSRCRRRSRIECLSPLKEHIDDHLAMGWSPEQISGRLRLEEFQHRVSPESIYRYIYRPKVRPHKLHRYLARAKATLEDGVISSAAAIQSGAAVPSMNETQLSITGASSATGKAISCNSAPKKAIS